MFKQRVHCQITEELVKNLNVTGSSGGRHFEMHMFGGGCKSIFRGFAEFWLSVALGSDCNCQVKESLGLGYWS